MADRKLRVMYPDAHLFNKPSDADLVTLIKTYGEINTYFGLPIYSNPIGIEIELEKAHLVMNRFPFHIWRREEDGSLKDHGLELISPLLCGKHIDYALHEFGIMLAVHPEIEFNHRCSIHVHVNVSEFTKYQLATLAATYAMLEECYFDFAEPIRRGNSFCYPLVSTSPEYLIDDKTKYCAFNMAPVRRQYTVEFRHLEGTKDLKKIRRWVALVTKLVNFVGALPPKTCIQDTAKIISERRFTEYTKEIFGNTSILFDDRTLSKSIKNGELWALTYLTQGL